VRFFSGDDICSIDNKCFAFAALLAFASLLVRIPADFVAPKYTHRASQAKRALSVVLHCKTSIL